MLMPFIVTTERRVVDLDESPNSERLDRVIAPAAERVVSRRAVATLEEARAEIVKRHNTFGAVHRDLTESGGTIQLPDGTIEVEPTTFDWLMEQVPDAFDGESPELAAEIIAAYNARQGQPDA